MLYSWDNSHTFFLKFVHRGMCTFYRFFF